MCGMDMFQARHAESGKAGDCGVAYGRDPVICKLFNPDPELCMFVTLTISIETKARAWQESRTSFKM